MVFIGAENIISPLGNSAEENFEKLREGISGIKLHSNVGLKGEDLYASIISRSEEMRLFQNTFDSIGEATNSLSPSLFDGKNCLILSTTKGEISKLKDDPNEASLLNFKNKIESQFSFFNDVQLVSNACISGVLGIIWAHDLIESGKFDNVVVCGVDQLSKFTLSGFQSFFALSDEQCKPFDKNRKGINLGEACASVVLSNNKELFDDPPMICLGGATSSDANHISGPSRTGEGLYRAIKKTIERAEINANDLDFISAHGTGTNYNDEMESIAFDRLGLNEIPLNSLKGYFGHTFGAAGVLETAICLQSMKNNELVSSLGFEEQGTSKKINVLAENMTTDVNLVLKTASGFGGSNAAILLKK